MRRRVAHSTISGVLEGQGWDGRNNSREMKYKTREDQVESVGEMAHIQNIMRSYILFLLNSFSFFSTYCFVLFLPLPLLFHVCILSVYQKAPDDKLIRVQREVGLCGWHRHVKSPGEGG